MCPYTTHEVFNQTPPLVNYNLFSSDPTLIKAVEREGAKWATSQLIEFGARLGTEEVIELGFLANDNPPVLHTHDRTGHRLDEVKFHPAWHQLMQLSIENGLHGAPWRDPKPGAHVARCAMMFLMTQIEYGHLCPVSMTYSVIPALRKQPEIAAMWEEKITSPIYDPGFMPAAQKSGLAMGMAMTEKQGGSDVRANTTKAVPINKGGPGGEYLITGHKWFCSAPMSDAFLVLAQTQSGLSCFFLPRWTPDGQKNRFFIQRLKNKLGNRSNASSEVEFDQAWARMVGEKGRGVRTIVEMVNHTRLDCVIGSAGMMRQALVQALHHTQHRSAFGKKLADQPLMQNVLTDLKIESEAATLLTMRLARAYDRRADDSTEGAFQRIATAVAKYWICKRAPMMINEALECHGGNGFIEDSIMPRLYREAPLNSIWEGAGNVICLDVLRALVREPQTYEALMAEIKLGQGGHPLLDKFIANLENDFHKNGTDLAERDARRLTESMALALQGSLLVQTSHSLTDAFCQSRLSENRGFSFGVLPSL